MSFWKSVLGLGRDSGRVLPVEPLTPPMPAVSKPKADLVERLYEPILGGFTADVYEDGVIRHPLMVEAAEEIQRLRKGLVEPAAKQIPMFDNGRSAYSLVLTLTDALGYLSALQQGGHVMDQSDIEDCECVLVNAACEIFVGLTGVRVSAIETYKKLDAKKKNSV